MYYKYVTVNKREVTTVSVVSGFMKGDVSLWNKNDSVFSKKHIHQDVIDKSSREGYQINNYYGEVQPDTEVTVRIDPYGAFPYSSCIPLPFYFLVENRVGKDPSLYDENRMPLELPQRNIH